jgi:hypothetical protein
MIPETPRYPKIMLEELFNSVRFTLRSAQTHREPFILCAGWRPFVAGAQGADRRGDGCWGGDYAAA